MTDKYISAEKLKDLICKYYTSDDWEQMGICGFINDYCKAEDVEPVKHGKWSKFDNEYVGIGYVCSNCLHEEAYNDYNYCPHCGAKMDL